MKKCSHTLVLFCSFLVSTQLFAEDLLEVVDKAQKTINQKYADESSIARKMAIEDLEKNRSERRNGAGKNS